MIIFHEGSKYSKEDMMQFYGFEDYASQCDDFVFIDQRINFSALDNIKKRFPDKKLVYFDIEEPNRFMSSEPVFRRDNTDQYFDKILTVCPYTAKWLNKVQGNNKRIVAFYPTHEKNIPPVTIKKYDVIYVGNINSKEILDCLTTMRKFNYRFVAVNGSTSHNFPFNLSGFVFLKKIISRINTPSNTLVTNINASYKEKMTLLSETKITIVHNLLFLRPEQIENITKMESYKDNPLFNSLPKMSFFRKIIASLKGQTYIFPQLKTRLFEAALSRSLILCRKDPWNEIERYFEKDTEFIYYKPDHLEEKIREILNNYDKYKPIIEKAFNKARTNYTTRAFVEKYLKNI